MGTLVSRSHRPVADRLRSVCGRDTSVPRSAVRVPGRGGLVGLESHVDAVAGRAPPGPLDPCPRPAIGAKLSFRGLTALCFPPAGLRLRRRGER